MSRRPPFGAFRWPFSWPIVPTMNNRALAVAAAVLAVVFVVLNFTVDDAGTLFLILAVAAAVASGFLFNRSRRSNR
jgi:membrane protein implicated in regulation of membrane protease activity